MQQLANPTRVNRQKNNEEKMDIDWLHNTCTFEGISPNGIIQLGLFYVNIDGDIIYRILLGDYPTPTDRGYIITTENHMTDIDADHKDWERQLKSHGFFEDADASGFTDAFYVAWSRIDYQHRQQIPQDYPLEQTILSAIPCTPTLKDADPWEEVASFVYLKYQTEKQLMHINTTIRLALKKPPFVKEYGTVYRLIVSFQLHPNIDQTYPSVWRIYKDHISVKGEAIINKPAIISIGFGGFIMNFLTNLIHQEALNNYLHNKKEFDCFEGTRYFDEHYDGGYFGIVAHQTSIKDICEEYINTILEEVHKYVSRDVTIDISEYEGENWWEYVYKFEIFAWQELLRYVLNPCFYQEDIKCVKSYVIQFLNYINRKYALKHPTIPLDGDIITNCKKQQKNKLSTTNFPYFREDLSEDDIEYLDKELRVASGKNAIAVARVINSNRAKLCITDVPYTKLHKAIQDYYGLTTRYSAFNDAMKNTLKS